MAEGQTKKRVRAPKPDVLKGKGVNLAGKWIVCSYCGDTSPKALVPAELIKGVAFHSFPCGVAWIEDHATAAQKQPLLESFATLTGQPVTSIVRAPATTDLVQFGGPLAPDRWLPNSELWAAHTELFGVSSDALPAGKQRKKEGASTGAVTFEVGMYVIPVKGAPKAVNALDGAAKKAGDVTPAGVLRKINKFATDNGAYAVHHFDTERYSVTACDSALPDPAHINNTATQLAGSSVYGPAVAIFTRKCSVKV